MTARTCTREVELGVALHWPAADSASVFSSLLLDAPVASAEGVPTELAPAATLWPAEEQAILKAVPRRRAQYAATRLLARRIYRQLGLPEQPLLNRADRSPIWPSGYVGSVTHTDRWCAVALAQEDQLAGVGIDAEEAKELDPAIVARLLTEDERQDLERLGRRAGQLGTLWFSAKEAVYKAIFPTVGRYVGFSEVELAFDFDSGRFSARARGERLNLEHGVVVSAIEGRFRRWGSLWVTSCVLRRRQTGDST